MERFYEVQNPELLAQKCRVLWGLPPQADIGPVNTNFPQGSIGIKLVVVCESPSITEIIEGYPTIGDTGKKLYNRWREAHGLPKLKNFSIKDHYHKFEANGIYITNLVRCRADHSTVSLQEKNRRVKEAWPLNAPYLQEELYKIRSVSPEAHVVFACGTAFRKEVAEAATYATELGMPWMESLHPPAVLALQYIEMENQRLTRC